MTGGSRCPRCGGSRAGGGVVAGYCPACLLQLAFVHEVPDLDGESEADSLIPESAYRVLTVIATDDEGACYLAEQAGSGRLVTLHFVKRRSDDEAGRREFRQRTEALARLSHPGIQPFIEARRTPAGEACVVAAYAHGPQLLRYCQSPRVDRAARVRIFSAICDAIAHAHRLGVCHGRLGPETIVMRKADDGGSLPIVISFGALAGSAPHDLDGLERIARAMGWQGDARPRSWQSVEELREAICAAWADDGT